MPSCKPISLRIRSIISNNVQKFYLTLKNKTFNRTIEIENEIEKRDFDDLWVLATKKLSKVRYKIKNRKEIWDIDYFKSKKKTYFALAEVEMEEGKKSPSSIIPFVKKNLIFEVPRNDNRFSSESLSNIKYAKKIIF